MWTCKFGKRQDLEQLSKVRVGQGHKTMATSRPQDEYKYFYFSSIYT